jgi:hypothetical protein
MRTYIYILVLTLPHARSGGYIINPLIYPGDNGRVLGYDSAHGQHHRHFCGQTTAVDFGSFGEIEARFRREWSKLVKEAKHAKD